MVEDEPKIAQSLKKGLEEKGYCVELAYDGKMGKQMFFENAYNLIILDINLPLINGYELCRIIRNENEQLPILMHKSAAHIILNYNKQGTPKNNKTLN